MIINVFLFNILFYFNLLYYIFIIIWNSVLNNKLSSLGSAQSNGKV